MPSSSPPRELVPPGCGSCTLCIDACPTDALIEPGVLDATRCLSTTTQSRGRVPEEHAAALEDRVYGCDICQDVCPWNAGPAARRAELPEDPGAWVSLADWLELPDEELLARHAHLYVPDRDRALPAPQRADRARQRPCRSSASSRVPTRTIRIRSCATPRAGALTGVTSAPMPSRSARVEHGAAEDDVVRSDAQVGDDDLAVGPRAERRRRASGRPGRRAGASRSKCTPR